MGLATTCGKNPRCRREPAGKPENRRIPFAIAIRCLYTNYQLTITHGPVIWGGTSPWQQGGGVARVARVNSMARAPSPRTNAITRSAAASRRCIAASSAAAKRPLVTNDNSADGSNYNWDRRAHAACLPGTSGRGYLNQTRISKPAARSRTRSISAHESPRTTKLYDRTDDEIRSIGRANRQSDLSAIPT